MMKPRTIRINDRGEIDSGFTGTGRKQGRHRIGDFVEIDRHALQFELAGLDLGEVEDVVDDRQK